MNRRAKGGGRKEGKEKKRSEEVRKERRIEPIRKQ